VYDYINRRSRLQDKWRKKREGNRADVQGFSGIRQIDSQDLVSKKVRLG